MMSNPTNPVAAPHQMPTHQYNKHRIEALSDGIFAVAMTLLVIELKLPEHGTIHSNADAINAVGHLTSKFIAWLISFFVLALFWLGHHRLFHYVRHVNGRFLALCLLQLGFVSLMPFSSALSGENALLIFPQIFYSINMTCLAILALTMARYIFRHPELTLFPMPTIVYKAVRIRTIGLTLISVIAVVIGHYIPAAGNAAFMLMILIGIVVRRMEAHEAKLLQTSSSTNSDNSAQSA